MKSIQTKIVLLILIAIVATSVLAGASVGRNATEILDEKSHEAIELMADNGASDINQMFMETENSVTMLSSYLVNSIHSVEDLSVLENKNAILEDMKTIALDCAQMTDGALGIYMRFAPELGHDQCGFYYCKSSLDGTFCDYEMTDLFQFEQEDIPNVGWYYMPKTAEKPVWIAPYVNKSNNCYLISYCVPLYVQGEFIGVLGMDVDFSRVEELVHSIRPYEVGYAFLAKDDGTIVCNLTHTEEMEEAVNDGQDGTRKNEVKSKTLINGMKLVVVVPKHVVHKERNELLRDMLINVIFVIVVMVICTTIITKKMVSPIKKLQVATEQILNENLDVKIDVNSKDEIGALANNFQKMTDSLKEKISRINDMAFVDSLTGLKNRTALAEWEKRINLKIEERGMKDFAIVFADVNNLKEANDVFGHESGDILLNDAAKQIGNVFKHSPVFRIGGDEFVVILDGADFVNVYALLDELEERTKSVSVINSDKYGRISIACGVSFFDYERDTCFQDVLKRADGIMYEKKKEMKRGFEHE